MAKEYKFKINSNDYSVTVNNIDETHAEVTVNDVPYTVELGGTPAKPAIAPTAVTPPVAAAAPMAAPAPRVAAPSTGAAVSVKSPLPGVVLSILVEVGSQVKPGQKLLVLEAMKMENNIDCDHQGTVKSINVAKGDSILEGDVLMTIE